MLGRPAQPTVAGLQAASVSLALPALKRGHGRFEGDADDPLER
jgi:hypothetical protein